MKTRTILTQHIELGSDLKLQVQRQQGEVPDWANVIFLDGGEETKVGLPAEDLERVAAVIARLRRDCNGHRDEDVCPDHGYYDRMKDRLTCPACEAERSEQKAIGEAVAT